MCGIRADMYQRCGPPTSTTVSYVLVLPPTRDRTEVDNPFLETQAFRRDGQDTMSGRHLFES